VKIYSYVVDHDTGYAPNPDFGLCTLCRCKFRKSGERRKNIVELAKKGDWVLGTGGASKRSAGNGKLIYAMRVDKTLTREDYYRHFSKRRRDNEPPGNDFEKHKQFALISRHFYYFGARAIDVQKFNLEKNSRGFHYVDPADFCRFVEWLERTYKRGKRGEPCQPFDKPKASKRCGAQSREDRLCRSNC
jgi:hypothetical protein